MKLIPLKKQSKRKQREYHAAQRGSWHGLSPVTRKAPNGKAYDRAQIKQRHLRESREQDKPE